MSLGPTADAVGPPIRLDIAAGVATVTIDHPPINLLTVPLFRELASLVDRLAVDDEVRAVVICSADPEWFIAHFDVEAILGFPVPAGGHVDDGHPDVVPAAQPNRFQQMCETLRTMPKPTIAVIEGRVGGGGSELASSCDMRFATPSAVFNQPEVALGIVPGGSGTVRLPRLIGRSRALEAILACDDIDAATAERWGWVNRIIEPDSIHPFVARLAARIASFPAGAVASAKASVVAADADLGTDLLFEAGAFDRALGDPAARSAMQRFLAAGGQTPAGERRLGALVGELDPEPGAGSGTPSSGATTDPRAGST